MNRAARKPVPLTIPKKPVSFAVHSDGSVGLGKPMKQLHTGQPSPAATRVISQLGPAPKRIA